jgi:cell division protein FtsW (lipid II flippase)
MILLTVGVAGFYTKVVDRWLVTSNFAINYFEITKFTFIIYWACVLNRHKITFFSIIPGVLLLVLIFLLGSKYSLGVIILLLISLILMLIARFSSSIAAGLLVVFQIIYLFVLSIPLYKESLFLGGVLGVGLGESKYKILFLENTPDRYFEAFSDSIFRITLEEFGVVGAILIILLFLIYTLAGLHIAVKIQDLFGRLLVFGVIGVTSLQAFQNFGISISAIPFEGISLPFIGYGGTQSLVNMLFCGAILNIARYSKKHSVQN